jgi:hypothetical protein
VHIGEKDIDARGADFETIGEVKPWLFAKDRWFDICDIIDNYPDIQTKGIQACDLIFTCKDEKFQDIVISPTLQESQVTKDMVNTTSVADAKQQLDFYTSPTPIDKQLEVLDDLVPEDQYKKKEKGNKPAPASEAVSEGDKGGSVSADEINQILDGRVPF